MKKIIIIIVIIALAGIVIWWMMGNNTAAPAPENTTGGANTTNQTAQINATGKTDDVINSILNDANDNALSAASDPSIAADDASALGNLGQSLDTSGL